MKRSTCWTLLAALAVGCGGGASGTPVTPANAPDGATVATGANEAPAHEFTPRQHPPRVRPPAPPPPALTSLPALVDNAEQCFPHLRPRPVRQERPSWHRGGGSGPGGGTVASGSGAGSGAGFGRGAAQVSGLGGVGTTGSSKAPRSRPMKKSAPKRDMAPSPAAPPAPSPVAAADSAAGAPAPMSAAMDDDADAMEMEEAPPRDREAREVATEPTGDDRFDDWGQSIYLSNDDTMSLSSAQRVLFAIDNFLPLPQEHIRPHELLNYFSFETARVDRTNDFSVTGGIAPKEGEDGIYTLALAVSGRPVSKQDRRNANVAFVIDRSGSMSAEGRMEYLKRGLLKMTDELKRGDIVHLSVFDHRVCSALENFVVGRDPQEKLLRAIRALRPQGSTNLHAGLTQGYEVADRAYQPTYTNRVVMVTDAETNTGVTDERLISTISKFYDQRRIRLSGVGVGRTFNDRLLDRLTERGKGAYVFLGSEAEVDAVFGSRFVSLIETTAEDVHFRLHLPPSLRMNVFYGEESSTVKEDVQAIHYFANTSQLFLSDLMARGGELRPQDEIMLTIEYEDPESGKAMVEEYDFRLADLVRDPKNVQKGGIVMRFIDGLAEIAARPEPRGWGRRERGWSDPESWQLCEDGRRDIEAMARGVESDPEVQRISGLWDKYCSRFDEPREPLRRNEPGPDAWPGASGGGGPRRP